MKALLRSLIFAAIAMPALPAFALAQSIPSSIDRSPVFWNDYKLYVVGASALFVAQMALIAGLLVQRQQRRRAERALRESQDRYRNVVETQTELICRFLPDTTLTFVNDAYCRFWRKTPQELLGTSFLTLIPETARGSVQSRIAALVESRRIDTHEHEVLLPDGGTGWQHWTNQVVMGADGAVQEVQAIGRDITERMRAEEGLREHQTALSASYRRIHDLAGRLIAGQETERHRIARELHDDLSQKLALLIMDIEQLGRGAPQRTANLTERVDAVSRRAAEIAADVHRLSHELHPTKLEALGLVAAVHSVCRDVGRQHGIAVEFRHHRVPETVPPQVALCCYRIVQEALHNVVKHSGARRASVQLTSADGMLDLTIADPGVGFVPTEVKSSGLGLVSMHERVNFIGGLIAIHSSPARGTRIGVRVSMERREREPGPHPNPQSLQGNVPLAALPILTAATDSGSIRAAARRLD
jgi:PAS domain S-box-containing protein